MEHCFPNMQRYRNRPVQNLRLPVRLKDHRQGTERPSSLPLGRHRICCSQPPRASDPLHRPMQANGRDMESTHSWEMLLTTHHLLSRLHRLRAGRLHGPDLRRHSNLHPPPPSHEHSNKMGSLHPHGPRLPNRRLRHRKSHHPKGSFRLRLHLRSLETSRLHYNRAPSRRNPRLPPRAKTLIQ